jgi:hypothetical protein
MLRWTRYKELTAAEMRAIQIQEEKQVRAVVVDKPAAKRGRMVKRPTWSKVSHQTAHQRE